jgi:hypothetical protein
LSAAPTGASATRVTARPVLSVSRHSRAAAPARVQQFQAVCQLRQVLAALQQLALQHGHQIGLLCPSTCVCCCTCNSTACRSC